MEIHNGELTLNVEVDGDPGAPPVLLLHGITSTARTWDWLLTDLAPRYRVLRLDFRGHGRSSRAPGDYTTLGYVSDAAAACREAAGGPCVVIGHSLGGATAAALAQLHPDLVHAVVLEDPPLGMTRDLEGNSLMDGFRLMRESVPQLQQAGLTVDVLADMLAQMPAPAGRPMGEMLHRDALAATAAGLLELDASVLDPVLDGTITPAFDPAAPIPVPVLLLTADPSSPDAVTRPADVAQLATVSPHAEIQVMNGASHLIHDELAHRELFREIVTTFVDRISSGR